MTTHTLEAIDLGSLSTVTGGASRPEGNDTLDLSTPGARRPVAHGRLLQTAPFGTFGRQGLGADPRAPEGPGNVSG